jgi:hypothetical protein
MRATFWHDAIEKEMKRIHEAMQEFDGDIIEARKRLIGYQQINCHMVFNVKMEGLARKVRYVAGGHTIKIPKSLTYASVVTRESVRIRFLIAALTVQPASQNTINDNNACFRKCGKIWA